MALFKIVVWAIIFLTKLRFLPGISIATVFGLGNAKMYIVYMLYVKESLHVVPKCTEYHKKAQVGLCSNIGIFQGSI